MADTTATATTITINDTSTAAASITIEAPGPPPLPDGARTVNLSFLYVEKCLCSDCIAHRQGLLYWGNDHSIVSADCFTRQAPHEYPKSPPDPNTDAWRERSARGSKLLRSLLTGEQLKVWDRFRSLIIRYREPYDCGCDSCRESDAGATGLLLTPEDDREFGRWEFDSKGGLLHKRNLWPLDQSLWSYEDELISLLLFHRSDPGDFLGIGCFDRAAYYKKNHGYSQAARIMRRIGRFSLATKEGKFALADQPGMFAGAF